jgi:hypothetical protein
MILDNNLKRRGGDIVKSKSICILLVFLLTVVFQNKEISYANTNESLFSEILLESNSELIEYGLKMSLSEVRNEELLKSQLLDAFKCTLSDDKKTEKSHYIEFKNDELQGYLESVYESTGTVTNLEIIKHGQNLRLAELQDKLLNVLESNKVGKIKSLYRYIKAKTFDDDKEQLSDKIITKLRYNKAENIDKIDLGNTISITALTGRYERIKNGEAWIDFNSAICGYESGNYLIIGTPIIMKEY